MPFLEQVTVQVTHRHGPWDEIVVPHSGGLDHEHVPFAGSSAQGEDGASRDVAGRPEDFAVGPGGDMEVEYRGPRVTGRSRGTTAGMRP